MKRIALLCVILGFVGQVTSDRCIYFICTQTFHPWTPQLAQDKCGWQVAKPIANVRLYSHTIPCPSNVHCPNQAKVRSACNCREVLQCRWAAWGSWTGTVPDGSCQTQRRTRLAQPSYRYREVFGGCGSVTSSCPRNDETQNRQKCRCRKADICALSPWTTWSGHIPNGQCATQTSTQPVTPHYVYIDRADNCTTIQSSCNPPRTNTRTKCLCSSKKCEIQQWTQWSTIPGPVDLCPKEAIERGYTSVTEYIDANNDCNNIGIRNCPPRERKERPKVVKCPRLTAPPYGRPLDNACDGVSSNCHSTCGFACNNGFELRGKASLKCQGNGNWDGAPPICHDILDPIITCPNVTTFTNEPGKNYVTITVPRATAFDLVAVASVTSNHTGPLKLVVGSPVKVKYTAEDTSGNKATCTAFFQATDNEPPRVISCPDNIEKTTTASAVKIQWPEPVFDDNVEGRSVDRSPNLYNGQYYKKGLHKVFYEAKDKAGNTARCEFNITIKSPDNLCKAYEEPKNGSLVCNSQNIQSSDMYVCAISCQRGYGFAKFGNSKAYNFYLCRGDGSWYGTDTHPSRPSPMHKLEGRPWQDCSKNYPADAIIKHFTIMAGPCNANKTKAQLKKEFQDKMKDDIMIKYLFCTQSRCDITDIQVSCATSRKRSAGTMKVEFDLITIPDHPPAPTAPAASTFSSVQDLQRIEELLRKKIEETIIRLNQYLKQLEDQIKRILAHLLKINELFLQIISKPFEVGCPHGSTLSTFGNPPKKLCTKCPVGEMYDSATKTCTACPKGTFQDVEGKSYCIACPRGSTTLSSGASSVFYCKDICGPGTYSRAGHGLSTCMACRQGFYQPNSRQASCLPCPSGKTTAGYGSTSPNDCS